MADMQLTREQQMRNVAECVLEYTEVKRPHNGRGRHHTYAQDIEAIAGAARQLAEMVLDMVLAHTWAWAEKPAEKAEQPADPPAPVRAAEQPHEGKQRRLREWLSRFDRGAVLFDLDAQAFREMTYAEYCQMLEWEDEYETVGDVLAHLERMELPF